MRDTTSWPMKQPFSKLTPADLVEIGLVREQLAGVEIHPLSAKPSAMRRCVIVMRRAPGLALSCAIETFAHCGRPRVAYTAFRT